MHAPCPPTLYRPTPQTTAVALVDPAGQAYPALHDEVQAVPLPVVLLHLPPAQSVHDMAPKELYFPAGHDAAVALVDPASQKYPALHNPVQDGLESEVLPPHRPSPH